MDLKEAKLKDKLLAYHFFFSLSLLLNRLSYAINKNSMVIIFVFQFRFGSLFLRSKQEGNLFRPCIYYYHLFCEDGCLCCVWRWRCRFTQCYCRILHGFYLAEAHSLDRVDSIIRWGRHSIHLCQIASGGNWYRAKCVYYLSVGRASLSGIFDRRFILKVTCYYKLAKI